MEQLHFLEAAASVPPPASSRHSVRGPGGRFTPGPGPSPSSAEVATVWKAEGIGDRLSNLEYPNPSQIVRHRSQGQGIRFYDTMEGTDSDLAAFFRDLVDDVLHYPYTIQPASADPEHVKHAEFFKFAMDSIPDRQDVIRHLLTSYARGFSVTEKMFRVVDRGQWQGAVIYDALLDKPQRWFTFDPQRQLRMRTFQNTIPGELVPQEKFIVCSFGSNSNPFGEPLFDLCYWAWFLKHHALKNQAIFMEKWASPTPRAEYDWTNNDKLNKENKQKALEVLMSIQHDNAVAIPKGMVVSLMESLRNGTVSFDTYINQLTEQESRIVTGQLLTSMGAEGGSHALGKVHEKRAANKVEMLANFVSHKLSRYVGRDLIDRNYGPQDAYPILTIIAKSPLSRQADAELEKSLMENGHKISRSWSDTAFCVVPPIGPDDELTFPVDVQPSQTLPVNTGLAAPAEKLVALASLPTHRDLHAQLIPKARAAHAAKTQVGVTAARAARPAIKKAVKTLASTLRAKKTANASTKATVVAGLPTADVGPLGHAYDLMLRPDAVQLAGPSDEARDKNGKWTNGLNGGESTSKDGGTKSLGPLGTRVRFIDKSSPGDYGHEGTIVDHGIGRDIIKWDDGTTSSLYWGDEKNRTKVAKLAGPDDEEVPPPPDISDDAKLALALTMISIANRIADAAQDAPADMTGDAAADSMSDPNGVSVDEAYANLFEGTHSTNIASIATARLRSALADPKFRAAYPYVMIVAHNPDARLSHRMMDGYILSAEDARFSPYLPPFDFGCDCQAIPISLEQAKAAGLVGSAPAGSVPDFLAKKGATDLGYGGGFQTPGGRFFQPGAAPGFVPPMQGTDVRVQAQALRAKAEELRSEDPEAWAKLQVWLLWLFGFDILTQDPPPAEENDNEN